MIKKLSYLLLSISLIAVLFCGCQSTMKFDTEADMRTHVMGVWENGTTYYVIDNSKAYRYYDWELTRRLSKIENDESIDMETLTFDEFYEENPLITPIDNIVFGYGAGKILSRDDKMELFRVLEDGNLKFDDEILTQVSSEPSHLRDLIEEEYNAELRRILFNKKYSDLPTAREVQYDKYGHLFDDFIITGTAELDDYYNWGYENYEYGFFCINIRPTGGTYSDEWYVYANRNTFSDLYASLQSGSKNVTLVAQLIYVDTGSNNMATLVDYKN